MAKDNIFKLFNAITFNKEKSELIKKLDKCKTRKCKLNLRKANITLRKEQDKHCPEKASNGFNDNDCLDKVYSKSNYSRILKKHIKCYKKKCSKELKALKKLY